MRYPFYTWLSVIGVLIQFVRTAIQIIFIERPISIKRWIGFCFRFLLVLVGFIMIPAGLMLIPLDVISQHNAIMGTLWNAAIFVVVSAMGILAARNLYRFSLKR